MEGPRHKCYYCGKKSSTEDESGFPICEDCYYDRLDDFDYYCWDYMDGDPYE